jgi:hypothetical protein
MERNKREGPWVAPELFYVYGLPNSVTSLEYIQKSYICIQRKQMHTWLERWHNVFGRRNGIRDLFCNAIGMSVFIA